MDSSWLMIGLALTESAACLAALLLIVRSGHFLLWRALAVSLALECLTNPIGLYLAHKTDGYSTYFYFYWGTSAVQTLLRLYIAAEVAQSFPQAHEVPIGMRSFMTAFCVGAAALGLLIATRDHYTFSRLFSTTAILLNKNVSFAWFAGVTAGLVVVKVIGFGWDFAGAGVARAITFRVACASISGQLLTYHSGQLFPWASGLDAFSSFATPLLLCYTFSQATTPPLHRPDPPTRMSPAELDQLIKSLLRQER